MAKQTSKKNSRRVAIVGGLRTPFVKSATVFKNLSALGWVFEGIFNRSGFWPYFYESKLPWLLPCFEIRFELRVEK